MNFEEAPGLCEQLRQLVNASALSRREVESILAYMQEGHDPSSRIHEMIAEVRDGFRSRWQRRATEPSDADPGPSTELIIRAIGRLEFALGTQFLPRRTGRAIAGGAGRR